MSDILAELTKVLEDRKIADPAKSYVASLYAEGTEAILKKISEEAAEVVIAGKSGNKIEIIRETADLWFHTLVLLSHSGLNSEDVLNELKKRFGQSGLAEKANRSNKIKD